MFRRTDSQATFGSLNVLLSPKKIAKLEKKHWADGYRLRSGIEATNSEYKRFYGGGRFRNEAEITSRFAGPRE